MGVCLFRSSILTKKLANALQFENRTNTKDLFSIKIPQKENKFDLSNGISVKSNKCDNSMQNQSAFVYALGKAGHMSAMPPYLARYGQERRG